MLRRFTVFSFVCLIFKGQFTLSDRATVNVIDASGSLKRKASNGDLGIKGIGFILIFLKCELAMICHI